MNHGTSPFRPCGGTWRAKYLSSAQCPSPCWELAKAAAAQLLGRTAESRLFSSLLPRFSQPKAFSTPVFVDEFNSGLLQSGTHCFFGHIGNSSTFFLEVNDR